MRLKKMCNQTTNALHKKWQVDNEGYSLFTDYLEAKDYNNNYHYNGEYNELEKDIEHT